MIKVGVIGYGGAFNMGGKHLAEMQKAGMVPVCACDVDEQRLAIAKEEFPGLQTYTSVQTMLEQSDVDLVAIITPHNTHADLALQCLRAGRHVVCEKPLAITTHECDAMIEEANKQDLVLSTYHNRHWDGCILRAVERIRDGAIGQVVRIEAHMGRFAQPGDWWRSSRSISGGILYDWGVHLLEYSLQLLGDAELTEVTGFLKTGVWGEHTAWKEDTIEDEGYAVARFDTGQWVTLCVTNLDTNPKEGQLEITGTDGTYIFAGNEYTEIKSVNGEIVRRQGTNPASEGWRFYQNVADALCGDEPLVISAEYARRPIHILDLAVQSATQGRTLPASYA
jgi:predicted dehydrogenase